MARNSSIFRRIVQLWLDAESVRRTKAGLQDALNKGTDVKGLKKNFTAADKALSALRRTALGLGASFLAIFSSRKLIEWADTWKLIQGRLKLVTDGTANLSAVTQRLQGIAARTRSSFEGVATLFQRVALNADQLGRSQGELLDITETVSKSIQIGGATASEAAAGVQQLAQALASGRLQGDEFRSIMENMPDLARRLAQELGVTVGELRAMSKAGELTADVIVDAILRMKEAVDEDFKEVPVTIGGAFTVLGNSIMEFVGQADEGTGASNVFADAILAIAQAADITREALEKLDRARTSGAQIVTRGGQEILILPPPESRRRGPPGGDFGTDVERMQFEQAAERARAASPQAIFAALLSRLESERTAQIVKAKGALAATAEEAAELNELYRRGNEMLRAGNLSLEQRADLVAALASLGFEEGKKKVEEDVLKLQQEQLDLLVTANELGVATLAERRELDVIHGAIVATLKDENLAIERRILLTKALRDIEQAVPSLNPESFRRAPPRPGVSPIFDPRRDSTGEAIIRAPAISEITNQDLADTYRQQWLDAHADVLDAAESTAFGAMGAWADALELLRREGEGLQGFLEALFRGLGAAALGGLAQYASAKVAENIAAAVEESAKATGQAAILNFPGAALHAAAATGHKVAAVKWGLLGGVAAAGQAALASGGAGGRSGGIPSGARDPAGRIADRIERQQTITIINYVDGINPKNGEHQVLVGETNVNFMQRRGSRITDGSRR